MKHTIMETLKRIESKLDGKLLETNRYIDINQAARLTNLSTTTLRRAITRGELEVCGKSPGKILLKESDIIKWMEE